MGLILGVLERLEGGGGEGGNLVWQTCLPRESRRLVAFYVVCCVLNNALQVAAKREVLPPLSETFWFNPRAAKAQDPPGLGVDGLGER